MRVTSILIAVALGTFVIGGCGGGGGGGKKGSGVLSLFLDGTPGTASGPTGTSQHVVVYRSDGSVVDERLVDLSSGNTQVDLTGLPSGTLQVHLELLSSTGDANGVIDTTIDGSTASAISTAIRQPIDNVVVKPATASVKVGSTQKFYAAARTQDDRFVYVSLGGFDWSSSATNVATVASNGIATGVAEGTSTIQATVDGTSISGSSTLSVTSNSVTRGKWTVMVFLNAANSLFQEAGTNVNQMERIANNPDVRFVYQWKQTAATGLATGANWTGTRRYVASYGTASSFSSTLVQDMGEGVDMGSPQTLKEFVEWTKANYPADHYALVMWDHGSGWRALTRSVKSRAISLDDETGNYIEQWQLGQALANEHFDILAYDACLMQGAEDLLEVAGVADYVIGSEENTPGPGYPYDKVFKPFVDTPDDAVPDLAKNFVTAFQTNYANSVYSGWALHQSVLDMSKLTPLRTAIDNLGSALVDNASTVGAFMPTVRANSKRIPEDDAGYNYYDLDQVAANIEGTLGAPTAVINAATAVRTAISNMVVLSQSNSHGGHMHGLSIEFSNAPTFATVSNKYANLKIASQTQWDEFLSSTLANPSVGR